MTCLYEALDKKKKSISPVILDFFVVVFCSGHTSWCSGAYFWLYDWESVLVMHWEPYVELWIKLRSHCSSKCPIHSTITPACSFCEGYKTGNVWHRSIWKFKKKKIEEIEMLMCDKPFYTETVLNMSTKTHNICRKSNPEELSVPVLTVSWP